MLTDAQRLAKLVRAEGYLKQTKAGYSPSGPWWKRGMPLLWEVRQSLDGDLGRELAEAHSLLKQTEKGYDPRAHRWREAMLLIDSVERDLARPPVPNLGPVLKFGKPILLEAPTHNTDGLFDDTGSEYPAFDFGWIAGLEVLAPEPLRVTQQSGSMGGDAFYAQGESSLSYWFGHLVSAPATGVRFARGDVVGRIAAIPREDHGHLGIDARPLIHRDLKWGRNGNGPDYTYGAEAVGRQLARGLA